jgi:hypothetical protein
VAGLPALPARSETSFMFVRWPTSCAAAIALCDAVGSLASTSTCTGAVSPRFRFRA